MTGIVYADEVNNRIRKKSDEVQKTEKGPWFSGFWYPIKKIEHHHIPNHIKR